MTRTSLIKKKAFSSTRVLKADSMTLIAFSNFLPLNHIPFIFAIGIGSTIFGYMFTVQIVGLDGHFLLGAMNDYLNLLEDINNYVTSNIDNFSPNTLRELLEFYQRIISVHEIIFRFPQITELLDTLEENSSTYDLYNSIFERWRAIGNTNLEIYRNIEEILDIPRHNSSIPTTLYE